jgi:hypothetical protein
MAEILSLPDIMHGAVERANPPGHQYQRLQQILSEAFIVLADLIACDARLRKDRENGCPLSLAAVEDYRIAVRELTRVTTALQAVTQSLHLAAMAKPLISC